MLHTKCVVHTVYATIKRPRREKVGKGAGRKKKGQDIGSSSHQAIDEHNHCAECCAPIS
jgi:hypothetical protein